jgi:hypothetical protein
MNKPMPKQPMQMVALVGEPSFAQCGGWLHAQFLPDEFHDQPGLMDAILTNVEAGLGHGADHFYWDAAARSLWLVYCDRYKARCYRIANIAKATADRILRTAHSLNTSPAFEEPLFFAAARLVLGGGAVSESVQ